MDKNTIVGFVLMGLVLVLFTWLGRPSQQEIEMQQRYNDSIALVQAEATTKTMQKQVKESDIISENQLLALAPEKRDSIMQAQAVQKFGELAPATKGKEELFALENDSIRFLLSTKGGVPVESQFKYYNDYLGHPVRLIRPGDADFNFTFVTTSNRVVNTKDLFFKGQQLAPNHIAMTATAIGGQELVLHYKLRSKYILEIEVESKDFHQVMASHAPYLDASIALPIYQNEKSHKTEQQYSGIAYEASNGDVSKLSTSKSEDKDVSGTVKWVALRDMFFSTIAYSPQGLQSVALQSTLLPDNSDNLKKLKTQFALAIDQEMQKPTQFMLYVGPNDYTLLQQIDEQLDKLYNTNTSLDRIVEMGSWFRFINIWLILPIFNFLEKFFVNYGIIILLLTFFIKIVLTPFTYKSFMSQAKMRVLKPQVDAINEKYPGDDKAMERQRATMELYRKAGVNTLGGCLPMLLQMPILIAMYQYFPTSINLRGESFLWANDLSTYDDVIRFGFDVPFIGGHLSLFTLLMTITQVVYMNLTQKMSGQQQMPGLKFMPYIMGIMLFFFLNQNAAGLSYYYLLSMLISMIQTKIFGWIINEDKVLAKLEENKKKPRKKSKWMERLEQVQKEQERRLREQKKR